MQNILQARIAPLNRVKTSYLGNHCELVCSDERIPFHLGVLGISLNRYENYGENPGELIHPNNLLCMINDLQMNQHDRK